METRAPYALIGLFVMAVIAAAFGFVYWLHNSGGLTERTVYRVHFENTVSGLLKGASVLFNGIRVGEVTDLQLDTNNPQVITATIAVDAGTPVRADTKVGLDFQGLTGVPVVTLQGGSAPLNAAHKASGEPYRSGCGPVGRTEHDQCRARHAPASRHHSGGQFRADPQHDGQSQHVHGSAGAQLGQTRRHRCGT